MTEKPLTHNERKELLRWCSDLTSQMQAPMSPTEAVRRYEATVVAAQKQLLDFTSLLDEHPEEWDGPCLCQLCMSYAAND
jgi:hypothetical protein